MSFKPRIPELELRRQHRSDSIYSNCTVSALQESARRGVKIVLQYNYPGIRFEFKGVVDELTCLGFMNDVATISVPPVSQRASASEIRILSRFHVIGISIVSSNIPSIITLRIDRRPS